MAEAEFLAQVLQFAKLHGWRSAHFRPAKTGRGWRTAVQGDGKGFPDLVLVRARIVIAELKADDGRTTPEQKLWLAAFAVAGVETYIWQPKDWPEIEQVLGR